MSGLGQMVFQGVERLGKQYAALKSSRLTDIRVSNDRFAPKTDLPQMWLLTQSGLRTLYSRRSHSCEFESPQGRQLPTVRSGHMGWRWRNCLRRGIEAVSPYDGDALHLSAGSCRDGGAAIVQAA
jgi:hypothetical protein